MSLRRVLVFEESVCLVRVPKPYLHSEGRSEGPIASREVSVFSDLGPPPEGPSRIVSVEVGLRRGGEGRRDGQPNSVVVKVPSKR